MSTEQESKDKREYEAVLYIKALLSDGVERDTERWFRALQNFKKQVRLQLKQLKWTQVDLARAAKISQPRVSQLLSRNERPNVTIDTLSRVASALDCSLDVRLCTFQDQVDRKPQEAIMMFQKEFDPDNIVNMHVSRLIEDMIQEKLEAVIKRRSGVENPRV